MRVSRHQRESCFETGEESQTVRLGEKIQTDRLGGVRLGRAKSDSQTGMKVRICD